MEQWRVFMFGGSDAGTASIAIRFTQNFYTEAYDPTLEEGYRKRMMVDGRACTIEILETAGAEQFTALRHLYIQDAQGFILAFSSTSQQSFERLRTFREELLGLRRQSPPVFMLVGNNYGKASEREVSRQDAVTLAKHWGCDYMEVDVRTGMNIDSLFTQLVRDLRRVRDGAKLPPTGGTPLESSTSQQAKPRERQRSTCIIV